MSRAAAVHKNHRTHRAAASMQSRVASEPNSYREVRSAVLKCYVPHPANQELTGPEFRGVTDVTSILRAVYRQPILR